jgi:aspartyl-tRNA(Asn)/glutamyl-tRNA(Gln) amidotransferase subunit A
MDVKNLNIDQINKGYKDKKFSVTELTKHFLDNIKKDKTNSFISINDQALVEAKKIDSLLSKKKPNKLLGLPIAIKDVIMVEGLQATAGSKMLKNYIAPYSATCIDRLKKAGVIILGKTNCDEFAMGSSNENSGYGPVKNPSDLTRVPGGSSGGSAAAVAASLAPVALGTDTGGSIRQPAAFCGVVGVKPTYGRISRYGLIAMASSLDQVGPFANSVKDSAYLLQAMAGLDDHDSTSSDHLVPDFPRACEKKDKSLRLGIVKEYQGQKMQTEISLAIADTVAKLKKDGWNVSVVSLPNMDYALAAYYLIMPAEVSSNLAKFDGLLYGLRGEKKLKLDEWYKTVRSQGFGEETKRRIMLGTYILSAGYYDAYYKQAQKVRTLVKDDFNKAFSKVDVILTPATPTTAFRLGEKTSDPLAMYLSDVFTVGANIAGIPGLVLPIARDKNNLPIGLQLLANYWQEEKLFHLGSQIEKIIKI